MDYELDWDGLEENFDTLDYTHPLLSETIDSKPLSAFLQDYIWISASTAIFPGFEKGLLELPVFVFTDYDNRRRNVVNLLGLNYFELLKFSGSLFVETKKAGTLVLRGVMPEEFFGDRGTREKWKSLSEAADRRRSERRTVGWIPDADIGR